MFLHKNSKKVAVQVQFWTGLCLSCLEIIWPTGFALKVLVMLTACSLHHYSNRRTYSTWSGREMHPCYHFAEAWVKEPHPLCMGMSIIYWTLTWLGSIKCKGSSTFTPLLTSSIACCVDLKAWSPLWGLKFCRVCSPFVCVGSLAVTSQGSNTWPLAWEMGWPSTTATPSSSQWQAETFSWDGQDSPA